MPMKPCEKCSDNYWSFEKIENTIRATCNMCGHEIEFEAKSKKQNTKELNAGDPCRSCGTKLTLKEPCKHKKTSAYYYTAYYFCPNCKKMYMSEKFKVWRDSKHTKTIIPSAKKMNGQSKGKVLYCDAGTQNNGQYGKQKTIVVITDEAGTVLHEEWVGDKTNNEGELIAILRAAALTANKKATIYSDSRLAVNWALGLYKTKIDRLKPLVTEAANTIKNSNTNLVWIPRAENHAGIYIEKRHSL